MTVVLIFPAVVTFTESGSIQTVCKVYATPDGVDVWHWNRETRSAEVIAHGPVLVRETDNVWTMTCDDGTPVRIFVDWADCGCGHPMKHFRPAAPVREHVDR